MQLPTDPSLLFRWLFRFRKLTNPPSRSGDDPRLYRSFVVLHLAAPIFGLPICACLEAFESRLGAITAFVVVAVSALWVLPFLAKAGLHRTAFLSVQLWTAVSLFGAYFYGGLNSPFAVWLLVAVLLAFAYVPQAIAQCTGAMILQGALFLFIRNVWPQPSRIEGADLGFLFLASSFAAALYVSLLAAFYSHFRLEGSKLAEIVDRYDEAAHYYRNVVSKLEEEDRRVTEFVLRISQELRTGLDVVIGYSELLLKEAIVEEREVDEGHLSQITASSRQMLTLVRDGDQFVQSMSESLEIQVTEQQELRCVELRPEKECRDNSSRLFTGSNPIISTFREARQAVPFLLAAFTCIAFSFVGILEPSHAVLLLCAFCLGTRFASPRRVADEVDMLTALPNRAAFQKELERRLAPSGSSEAALLFADLNGFKEVNDGLGHGVGDELLALVAKRFAAVRPRGVLLARLGGDEFGAAAFGSNAEAAIHGFAAAMQDALVEPVRTNEHQLTIGVSIGIAAGCAGQVSGQELLRRSDVAMYRAKQDGKTQIQLFDSKMDEALNFRRTMHQDLAEALAGDQLDLFLQPVVEARTGALASVEALLRWTHPLLGPVSPAKLIPLAEASGQIVAIDDWVLERALHYAKRLRNVPIAINISAVQFRQPGFSRKIVDRLAAHSVPARLLKLEVTEGMLVTHTRAADRTISELREAGVKIALDDFGTGYSSLSYLKDLGFDLLKVDRSFIAALDQGKQGMEFLRAIVDLAHSLSMEVVAEGVETAEQAAAVQLLGGDLIQGYFTGRPMSVEQLECWIQSHAADPRTYLDVRERTPTLRTFKGRKEETSTD